MHGNAMDLKATVIRLLEEQREMQSHLHEKLEHLLDRCHLLLLMVEILHQLIGSLSHYL